MPIVRIGTDTAIRFDGSAIIKNGKMVGRIVPEETFMVNAFNGRSTNGYIEVMDHATVHVVGNPVSHRSSLVGGRPFLISRLRMKVTVLETRGDPSPDLIRRELDRQLTEKFGRMFRTAQAHRADILSSGQWFRNKFPRERLEHWRSKDFPNLGIDFDTDAIIQNTGKLKAP
ncbi:Ger(x)C family spore germination C-terminal domain-containing protein [Paenibacillus sp.]|uniref:Ger(x)C family spore germination C-terminal domain-containing protein n=1 Tax=Paenibacillus sp. TaxID=58172 RepID=UPI002811C110|nr:Ger(x)C family spore germination C-terminal domain-containing protein [Paenibacillus sp.]